MTLHSVRLLLAVSLVSATALAADNPFTGAWRLNPAQSKMTDTMRVEPADAPNTYTFYLSLTNPETIPLDGTDQPGIFGTTLAVTVLGPNQWKVVRKKDGHMLISAIWDLSPDGNTLTDNFTGYRADGSTSNLLYKYARTTPGSGFVATWESTEQQVNSTYEIKVEPYDDNGLSLINPSQKMTQNLKFDDKDYAAQGPNLPAGYACSAHRLSDRSFEMTRKIDGKILDTQQIEVSPDGKTLTFTTHIPGASKPNISIFDRE